MLAVIYFTSGKSCSSVLIELLLHITVNILNDSSRFDLTMLTLYL